MDLECISFMEVEDLVVKVTGTVMKRFDEKQCLATPIPSLMAVGVVPSGKICSLCKGILE